MAQATIQQADPGQQPQVANPFDQFDPPANPFDQFDAVAALRQKMAQPFNPQDVYRAVAWRENQNLPASAGNNAALLSGVTLGWGDEAMAAMTAPIDMARRGETWEEAYNHNLARERDLLDQYRKNSPWADFVTEMAGALATGPSKAIGAAAEGASALGRLGKNIVAGVKQGVPAGFIYGAGNTETSGRDTESDLAQRAKGGAIGSAIGAGLGVTIPVVGSAIRASTRPIVNPVRAAFTPADTNAANLIGRDLARDQITPQMVRDDLAAAQAAGKPMTLADIAHPDTGTARNVAGLVRSVATGKSGGSEAVNAMVESRRLNLPGRIADDIKTALSNPDAFYPTLDRIIQTRKTIAQPLYEKAYAQPLPELPIIKQVVETPAGQQAVKYAQRLSQNEGIPFDPNTVRGVDLIKRAFDDGITNLTRDGFNNEARIIGSKLRDPMVRAVDNAVPEYRAARQAFSNEFDLQQALERGRAMVKPGQDPEPIIAEIRGMSDAEREVARLGMAREVWKMFDQPGNALSKINNLLNSNSMQRILGEIFPNKASADLFRKNLMYEARFLKRGQFITGGSPTANKLAEIEDAGHGEAAMELIKGNPVGAVVSATKHISDKVLKGMGEKTANSLGEMFTTLDPARQAQVLDWIEGKLPPGALQRALTIFGTRAGPITAGTVQRRSNAQAQARP